MQPEHNSSSLHPPACARLHTTRQEDANAAGEAAGATTTAASAGIHARARWTCLLVASAWQSVSKFLCVCRYTSLTLLLAANSFWHAAGRTRGPRTLRARFATTLPAWHLGLRVRVYSLARPFAQQARTLSSRRHFDLTIVVRLSRPFAFIRSLDHERAHSTSDLTQGRPDAAATRPQVKPGSKQVNF